MLNKPNAREMSFLTHICQMIVRSQTPRFTFLVNRIWHQKMIHFSIFDRIGSFCSVLQTYQHLVPSLNQQQWILGYKCNIVCGIKKQTLELLSFSPVFLWYIFFITYRACKGQLMVVCFDFLSSFFFQYPSHHQGPDPSTGRHGGNNSLCQSFSYRRTM